MSFKDMLFPIDISFGAAGGPGYSTDVVTINSGAESRNQNWSSARCAFDVSRTITTAAKRKTIIAFFRVAKGKAHSFRFRDFTDYQVSSTEGILTALTANTYQLKKRYTADDGTEDRTIYLPRNAVLVQGAHTLTSGVDYSLALLTGIVTVLGSPLPAPTAWSGEFDIPCRFDVDMLRIAQEDRDFYRSESIPIVETRDLA